MTPQERDVILGIFERLNSAERNQRDPEAEALIVERLKRQPYAPYVMAQQIYAQEQALTSLQQRLQEVEAELHEARSQRPQSGGFLSGIFGGGQQAAPPPRQGGPWGQQQPAYGAPQQGNYGAQPQGGPWGGQQAPAQRGGGGFLATAATTAVGVAGGMMLANALSNAFSGHGNHGQTLAGMDTGSIMPPSSSSFADPDDVGSDRNVRDASYDSGGSSYDGGNYDSGGYDSGGDTSDA